MPLLAVLLRFSPCRAPLLARVFALASVIVPTSLCAQTPTADRSYDPTAATEIVPLWKGRAPQAIDDELTDRPALTVFRPFGRRLAG